MENRKLTLIIAWVVRIASSSPQLRGSITQTAVPIVPQLYGVDGKQGLLHESNTSSVQAPSEEATAIIRGGDKIESLIAEANASYANLVNLSRWNRWRRRANRWGGGRRLADGPNTSSVPAASEEANTSFAGSNEIESSIAEANASYANLVNLSRWNRWRRRANRWGGGRRLVDGPNTSVVPAASEEAAASSA